MIILSFYFWFVKENRIRRRPLVILEANVKKYLVFLLQFDYNILL